jgi:dTDP-4-amino-4,6-dideoxy-D-galactose acyltransferase
MRSMKHGHGGGNISLTGNNRFRILEWDSRFFGMSVAAILPEILGHEDLAEVMALLEENGVRLAYWASDPGDGKSQRAAIDCRGTLVDRKITYVTSAGESPLPAGGPAWPVETYNESFTNSDLENLAVQAGRYSRFRVDPRIPEEKFVEMYKTWIRKSVDRQIADAVLVVRHMDRIVGMVTVGEKNGRGDIGLIAVDDGMRGKQVGAALVFAAQAWAFGRGWDSAQVVTQGENVAACRLYERCGYRIEQIRNVFHFWIGS